MSESNGTISSGPVMSNPKPFLVSAFLDWIISNNCTPYISVICDMPNVVVPQDYIVDGFITLNISGNAVRNFALKDDTISFWAGFDGLDNHIIVPVEAICNIYAKENGEGMMFAVKPPEKTELDSEPVSASIASETEPRPSGPPKLSVVK